MTLDQEASSSAAERSRQFPEALARHEGLFSRCDIDTLQNATVAIAGVGGVGGRLAEVLARSGVGHLRLADPDVFCASNLNRQAASSMETLGQKKVDAVGAACRSVSPTMRLELFREGVSEKNVAAFTLGADVVVDGTDYTKPELGQMVCEAAARSHIPVVIGVEVGFGAWHTVVYKLDDFKSLLGIPRAHSSSARSHAPVKVALWRWIAELPPYVDVAKLRRLQEGVLEAPAIAPAVELSAALLSSDVLQLLLGRKPLVVAPKIHMVDAVTCTSKVFRPTFTRFLSSVLRTKIRALAHRGR